MAGKIKNIQDLENARDQLRNHSDEHLQQFKESLSMAKTESRKALINNIVIPGAVAVGSFFAIRALIRKKRKKENNQQNAFYSPIQKAYTSELKRVDWMNIMVKVLPLLVTVGKRLYEEDNLPFLRNPKSNMTEEN